jgi:hypothetical protein
MQHLTPVTETFGNVTVQTWTDHEGISINVFTAGHRNSGLSATYLHDDREGAIAWYRTVRDAALDGQPVWLIEASVSALIDAAQATGADAELITAINATMDAADSRKVESARLNADVQTITADADPNWRSNLRREVVQAAKQTNQPKEGRLVHPTRSNVHLKPPTPAELDRIRQHHNGIVTTAPGQPWTLLRAIVRRGLAVEHEVHGRYVIASIRLNARGMALAGQGQVAA